MVYSHVIGNADRLESEQILKRFNSVKRVVDLNSQYLDPTLAAFSNWTEFRDALTKKDVAYIEENLNATTFIIRNVNIVISADLQGNIITQVNSPSDFAKKLPASLLRAVSMEKMKIGLYQTNDGLILVGISKVYDSEGKGKPAGLCVLGYYIDKYFVSQIKLASNIEVGLCAKNDRYSRKANK